MCIERRPLTPFGMRQVQRLKREREHMRRKVRHIHIHQQPAESLRSRCKPLPSSFPFSSRRSAEGTSVRVSFAARIS